jgi:tripartite-type tricarboxylate transporter receptor subunit TctC
MLARLALCLLSLGGAVAQAQDGYPSRSVTLVQGFGAGGNGDTIARIVAEPLTSRLGQPVVVEGRTGAGGNNASAFVARGAGRTYAYSVHRRACGFGSAV